VRLAIDGFDGSGKTTLATGIQKACELRNITCQVIGRKTTNSSAIIGAITELILRSDGKIDVLTEAANAHVRLARLHERMALAAESAATVIVYDRWIPSDLSRMSPAARINFGPQFQAANESAQLSAMFSLSTDFDTAWGRIDARRDLMSPGEMLGREHNQRLYAALNSVLSTGWLRDRIELDSSESEVQTLSTALLTVDQLIAESARL
jgi:thymidylate kinase